MTPGARHAMQPFSQGSDDAKIIVEANHHQLEYFSRTDPPARGLEIPEGILLRYNLSVALYFYLKSSVVDGKIATQAFASDTPYERQKAWIGEVRTPMFEADADRNHLQRLERMLRNWVEFVKEAPDLTAAVDPNRLSTLCNADFRGWENHQGPRSGRLGSLRISAFRRPDR
jgi:hypothetical protein